MLLLETGFVTGSERGFENYFHDRSLRKSYSVVLLLLIIRILILIINISFNIFFIQISVKFLQKRFNRAIVV